MKKPLVAYSGMALLVVAAGVGTLAWQSDKASKFFEKPPEQVVAVPPPVVEQKVTSNAATTAVELVKPAPEIAPSFDTVRVERNGDAVIAGRAAPGANVAAMLNGVAVAETKAGADGSFVMIPEKPLPPGAGALTLQADAAGKQLNSEQAVAVDVKPQTEVQAPAATVAVISPTAPTKILQAPQAPSDSVTLDAVDYDAKGNIVFAGRATKQSTVRLYADNAPLGETRVGDDGKWNFAAATPLAAGNHMLRADDVADDGKVSSRIERPFTREEPTKVAEANQAPMGTPKITVQPGNSLWKLSRQLYGTGNRYTVIFEANKDLIKNPALIYPGQLITAPQKAP